MSGLLRPGFWTGSESSYLNRSRTARLPVEGGVAMAEQTGAQGSVTLATLARELGVSKSTVSNAYNHPDQLSPALRGRILDAARRLGYPGPDPLAATLSRGRVGAIGLVFFDDPPTYPLTFAFTDPVHALFLQGVADACGRAGVGLVLLGGGRGGDLVRAALVDGFICQYDVAGDERFGAVAERGLPVVVVDGPPDPAVGDDLASAHVRRVGVDDRGAARAAARRLLDLGHRAIGVVAAPLSPDGHDGPARARRQRDPRYPVLPERLAGHRAEVEAAGLPR